MTFLQELEQLRLETPRLYNINIGSENSDYCTHSDKNKNCYLLFAANFNEDCLYGGVVLSSRDCTDCAYCDSCELCYECVDINHCYSCSYSQDLKNCSDCLFCMDCIGCSNCFGSVGLRQKQYYFFNEPLSKEEYFKRLREFDMRDAAKREAAMKKFERVKASAPHRALHMMNSENCAGDYVNDCKNCFACFNVYTCEDCAYCVDVIRTKDSLDLTFSDGTELCYECFSLGLSTYNCNFSNYIRTCSDCEYCELCFNCKHCFGCVGLQSKEFYILNQPYSREAYFKKAGEIKAQMLADGSYGKHLPTTYRYEDTAAVM